MESAGSSKEAVLEPDLQERPVCQHHWVIDKPAGPVSKGVCRLCGEKREFQNYIEGSSWGYDISLEQLSGGSRIPAGVDVRSAQEDSRFDEDA